MLSVIIQTTWVAWTDGALANSSRRKIALEDLDRARNLSGVGEGERVRPGVIDAIRFFRERCTKSLDTYRRRPFLVGKCNVISLETATIGIRVFYTRRNLARLQLRQPD